MGAASGSEPAALPVSQAPTYAINGVVNEYHYQWGSYTPGTATTVTYSFLTSVPGYYAANAGERNQFAAMNATQKQVARDTLRAVRRSRQHHLCRGGAGNRFDQSRNRQSRAPASAAGPIIPYPGYSGQRRSAVHG